MYARFWLWLVLAAACFPAFAAAPTFTDLLAKAEAQYDAGHRWSPPGDNMVETVAEMMDIISTATPQQLSELSALLEKGVAPVPDAAKAEPAAPAPPVAASAPNIARAEPVAPAPAVAAPAPNIARAEPVAPAPAVAAPAPNIARAEPVAPAPAVAAPVPNIARAESVAPAPAVAASAPNIARAEPAAPAPPVAAPRNASPSPLPSPPPKPSPQAIARAADLLARGKEAEAFGNVSGARRFYASAAALGNGVAALGLGRLYDPAFLKRNALGGIEPDAALARHWYQRAVALGDPEAGPLLEALSGR